MLEKSLVMVFAFLLCINLAMALDTDVTINTLSNHTLNLQFLNPSPPPISFESINIDSGETGIANYVFSNSAEIFDLVVILMDGNKKVLDKRFNEIEAGKDVMITLISDNVFDIDKDYVAPVGEVVENNSIFEELSNLNESGLNEAEVNGTEKTLTGQVTGAVSDSEEVNETEVSAIRGFFNKVFSMVGFAVADENANPYSKFLFYFIGGFVILGFAFFVFSKARKVHHEEGKEEEKKSFESKSEAESKNDDSDYVRDAESKMAEAEKEMKIADDEKRLKEDKERLSKDKEDLNRFRDK